MMAIDLAKDDVRYTANMTTVDVITSNTRSSLSRLSNHLHRHLFTMLLCPQTPPTMLDTIKFIGQLECHI